MLQSPSPFEPEGLARRVLPFALFAAAAELSLALPPGPQSTVYTVISVLLLLGIAGAILLPWDRLPHQLTVVIPLAYAAQVLFMILAAGGSTSGIGIVILIPLIWTALYHRRWESFVTLIGILVVEVITSLTPTVVPGAALLRRILFWTAIGILISVAAHGLRERMQKSIVQGDEQHRRTSSLLAAAQTLAASLSPLEVLATATTLAAELASPPGAVGRRAQYMLFDQSADGELVVRILAEYDETGQSVTDAFSLSEHPALQEVHSTGRAIHHAYDPSLMGPTVRRMIEELGITHSVYVPVHYLGSIHGVLAVTMRGAEPSDELFEHCNAVGHLIELALSNALAHDAISELATTDPLTGLANRRGFAQSLEDRPGRRPFAVLAMDVDGLKRVNDLKGHSAGDALLVHVAETLKPAMRRGDLLARLGGDEFAAFLFDADEAAGRRVAERMLRSLARSRFEGEPPRLSIGIAFGLHDSDLDSVQDAADSAMYLAKRLGGARYEVASSVLDDELRTARPDGEPVGAS